MNKPSGHYCRICGQRKASEKFSERGHAAHICKACAKRGNKPTEPKVEPPAFIDVESVDTVYADIDSLDFPSNLDNELPKKKRKRKPSKEKILRSAQKKQAKALLIEMLAGGDASKTTIYNEAAKVGISAEALHRAKGSLGICAIAMETGSVWHLPKSQMPKESGTAK